MDNSFDKRIKVGLVGGTGYTGVELLRILIQHPNVDLLVITSRKESGLRVSDLYPNLRNHISLEFSSLDSPKLMSCDIVFFATPHGVAMSQARDLLESGVKIIDLAADFRIKDVEIFEKWYKMGHSCPDILKNSEYGLVELNRSNIVKSNVIGNPGCYPTTVILGLIPLLDLAEPLIDVSDIVADCKSGVSGSGKKLEISNLFSESSDNFKAYGVSGHRHHPEIVSQIEKISGKKINLTFVPHLVPMIRGMFSTIYTKILPHALDIDFQELFVKRYKSEPFIDVMPSGSFPETRSVRSSNRLRIAIHRPNNENRLIILVIQDNLVKGAAGQAVQNMNLIFGLKETTGLDSVAILP
ncbi:N-acetyl-gamma-glutamyl-phosphate reductase [Candidatus Kinetoplastibacterium blastocrithidii TCC012E]|uniref:N-acetyl-gamma-glutamyl-phosphate reductase n=1 Tax=Candidatus Kinetoplastidibacterium blastocrithidiae TCC012E TaxID=1208922 RepID=M1LWX7_9PROT|nr:N-acetyl-gamma-glutamyl-phosphate reductase [Candidatus Kinetoplastibacterium blastocrithidii]AFZ83213.1 N-acetyl-gamma-glutamyl-phosphate reductase 1 [Candidatus Kinetoplastibacterium blastocrithidii (ex Strigomonas culicis)]AGF50027.1 N-acetyl-gamma-glutamyl-phosphate reductase [Candidatus Kinetoplastibacterium blastocrithidii TCC012E]